MPPSEHYAILAAQLLQYPPPPPPPTTTTRPGSAELEADISLVRCQCFLILGLYECTEGAENRGWMKIGTAIRMAQVLRLGFEDEDDHTGTGLGPARKDPLRAEVRRRTFWSCFLLDRTITDGKERPGTLQPPKNHSVRMPCSEDDFTKALAGVGARFETNPPPWTVTAKLPAHPPGPEPEADLLGHTMRVAHLWQRVADYIGAGGRNADRRPPWSHDSTFAILASDLRAFEHRLPEMYAYSEANLLAHSMIGQGRLFGMFHLLLACASLVLHRDYLPFLPPLNYVAAEGPVDGEPLYAPEGNGVAPQDWWMDSFVSEDELAEACAGSELALTGAGPFSVCRATLSRLRTTSRTCARTWPSTGA